MRDKDLTGMLQELASLAVKFIAVRSASPRARSAEDVASSARQLGLAAVVAESVSAALSRRSDMDRTVVCGSLAVVAEARAALGLSD